MSKSTRFAAGLASNTRVSQAEDQTMDTTSTHHNLSFVVPDIPNLSELVTGTYQYGVPSVSKGGSTRSSRFAAKQNAPPSTTGHRQLDSVPLPEDEKQIFAMLKLLRGKVDVLEREKAVAEKRAEDAEERNQWLRDGTVGRRVTHRDDIETTQESVVATQPKLVTEKANLEANLGSVQNKLEAAQRQMSIIELSIKNVSKERDSALAKSKTAHLTVEELKAENEALRRESQAYERELFKANEKQREQQTIFQARNSQRKKKAVVEVDTPDSEEEHLATSTYKTAPRQEPEAADLRNNTFLSVFNPSHLTQMRKALEDQRHKRNATSYLSHLRPERLQDASVAPRSGRAASAPPEEFPAARKSAMKNARMSPNNTKVHALNKLPTLDDDQDAAADADMSTNLDLTENLSRPLSELNRRASDPTITAQSNTSRRRAPLPGDTGEDNMTSGFFLPDVTVARPIDPPGEDPSRKNGQNHLSNAAQAVISAVSPHNKAECTFCRRISGESGGKVKIPAVTPPSLRTPAGPDVTARPAQPPRVSLAIVLKELGDELIHLKSELAQVQSRYRSFDPSMGRRARKALVKQIEKLEGECEVKSEQIYRLNDVAEREHGGEFEVTL